jgi:hypothetical protein
MSRACSYERSYHCGASATEDRMKIKKSAPTDVPIPSVPEVFLLKTDDLESPMEDAYEALVLAEDLFMVLSLSADVDEVVSLRGGTCAQIASQLEKTREVVKDALKRLEKTEGTIFVPVHLSDDEMADRYRLFHARRVLETAEGGAR